MNSCILNHQETTMKENTQSICQLLQNIAGYYVDRWMQYSWDLDLNNYSADQNVFQDPQNR